MMTRATGTRAFGLLMYGLILASAAAQFALVPVMPVYAHRLGLSGFQQGMVLGATGLAALAGSGPPGALAARPGFGAGYGIVWTAGLCWLANAAGGPPALGGSVTSAGIGGVAGPAAS